MDDNWNKWNKKDMAIWATEIALLSVVVALWINILLVLFGG